MAIIAPILATKLNIGRVRPTFVRRTRLLRLLDSTLHARLTLVTAPAGSGKTTILTAWASRHPHAVAWFTVDENDNSLTRFLLCCEAALQTLAPEIGSQTGEFIRSEQTSMMTHEQVAETFFTLLINDLNALGRDVILVLDDYHSITQESIHHGLNFLIRHLPPTAHVVIASRTEPPLPLARLRARGELVEIKPGDLRFSGEEIREFFELLGFDDIPPDTLDSLQTRTEGWAAGLQLIALSASDGHSLDQALGSFTGMHRHVADYLLEEVFSRQPVAMQRFLLYTGILNQLTATLCDAVMKEANGERGERHRPASQADSQAALEQLEQVNLFTLPLDHHREWYRYHQLFADFLRDRLAKTAPDLAPTLHRRAAAWYHQAQMLTEAITHYLSAGDSALAADLVEEYIHNTLNVGVGVGVLRWLEALPDALVKSRPVLCLIYAGLLTINGRRDRMADVQALLQAAYGNLADASHSQQTTTLATALPAIMSLMDGDMSATIAQSEHSLNLLMAQAPLLRGVLALNLGEAYRLHGDLRMATYLFEEASIINRNAGQPQSSLIALCQEGYLEVFSGDLRRAIVTFRSAVRQIDDLPERDRPPSIVALVYTGMSQVFLSWNDLDAAAFHADEGVAASRSGDPQVSLLALLAQARVNLAQRESDAAALVLERAAQVVRDHSLSAASGSTVEAHMARVALQRGALNAAQSWAQANALVESAGVPLGREFELLTRVQVLGARKLGAEALRLLSAALTEWKLNEERLNRSTLIEAFVWEAWLLQGAGRAETALDSLTVALTLAEPGGYLREFLDAGPGIATLLRQVSHPYAKEVLGHFEEKLSERELELLGLIATGLHNQDIAAKLVVTAETVKWHLKNIYRKLGVASRTEAIREAKARQLLR
jgi:LuxR family maltose regulon positive regulatory protein